MQCGIVITGSEVTVRHRWGCMLSSREQQQCLFNKQSRFVKWKGMSHCTIRVEEPGQYMVREVEWVIEKGPHISIFLRNGGTREPCAIVS